MSRPLKERTHIGFPKQGKAEQAHAEDADINQIMRKAMRGEQSDYINQFAGHYGDSTSLDFFEANIVIVEAQQMFDALPSGIRSRFHNQPGEFLDFVQDPANEKELIKLKLKNPPREDPPPPASPAAAPTTPPEPTPTPTP